MAEKCDTIYIPSFDLWSVFTIESLMEYITVAFLLRPDTQALKILMIDNTIIKTFDHSIFFFQNRVRQTGSKTVRP